MIADVDIDTTSSWLYAIQTVVDPNSNGETRVLLMGYDKNLNLKAAKLLSDASSIADEANGMRVDAGKDVRVGVTEYNSGSEIPTYEIETLNPALTQTLGIATTGQALDFVALVYCSTSGASTGIVGSTVSLTLTLGDPALGGGDSGAPVVFAYYQEPPGATGYGLSVASENTDGSGNATTVATLGNLPGIYGIGFTVNAGIITTFCYP